jgi:hypothetical protein
VAKRKGRQDQEEAGAAPKRVRATFYVDADLYEAYRNAAVFLAGPPVHATVSSLVEEALRRELARLERAHAGGKAFPKRTVDLRGRRPRGR